jgi:hypothetical protein
VSLTITLNLPPDIERKLRAASPDLSDEVQEAYVLELFRRGKLSHYELAQALGLDRTEADAYLKRHNVFEGSMTMDDLDADRRTLDRLFPQE